MVRITKSMIFGHRLDALHRIVSDCEGRDRRRASDAAAAIRRIEAGSYGCCMRCGMLMSERDTEARPERKHCSRCERAA